MAGPTWTEKQKQCIDARGGTLLVSAAAGSGKTAVLVTRVLQRITDPVDPIDVDRLLVVTFTKAAAAEMKSRLADKLSELAAEDPKNKRLQRQLLLLPKASISTVDSFCGELLREYAHRLGLPSDYRVADESVVFQLQADAVAEAVEQMYAEGGVDFRTLASTLDPGKSDKELKATILRLNDLLNSLPFPEEWMQAQEAAYETEGPILSSVWGQHLFAGILRALRSALQSLQHAQRLCNEDLPTVTKWKTVVDGYYADLQSVYENAPSLSWDELRRRICSVECAAATGGPKVEDAARREYIKALRDAAKKNVDDVKKYFFFTEERFCEDTREARVLIRSLFTAVRLYRALFAQKKAARRMLDFADIEHKALCLLVERENGVSRPTALAAELAERFEEIYVDEYQDTNETQEALFSALSRNETNLFFVGDIKQSIYSFRQACPQLFLRRRERCKPYDGKHFPAKIQLDSNFRSRHEITDSVNFFFRQLMVPEAGGIDYSDGEALEFGAAYYPEPETGSPYRTKLLIVDTDGVKTSDDGDEKEARALAEEIRRIHASTQVYDTKQKAMRPARYGDFCVLLRGRKRHASAYVQEFNRLGIPAWSSASGGFFKSSEVMQAVSLLRVIDNPLSDVPLLSVLMSPLYAFTPDEMAEIRLTAPHKKLYTALWLYSREDKSASARAAAFLQQLSRYRTLAATLPADRLLHRIYEDTSLPAIAAARSHGHQRIANLQLLYEKARSFEQNGFCGLSSFVRYLDRLEKEDNDIAPAEVSAGHANVVRIMSIHASKGLEFPFVCVAGLATQYSAQDIKPCLLFHAETGLGMKLNDGKQLVRRATLARYSVQRSIEEAQRNEELRILYVALTRAREKLILSCTLPRPGNVLSRLALRIQDAQPFSAGTVLSCHSFSDLILLSALRHPMAASLRAAAGMEDLPLFPTESELDVAIVDATDAQTEAVVDAPRPTPDEALAHTLEQRAKYVYPYAALGKVPNKLSASSLAHGRQNLSLVATSRPAFLGADGLSPTQRGTAVHTFMQYADYAAAARSLTEERDRLVAHGCLTEEQAASLPLEKLRRFFTSELYARMARADRCLREISFTVGRPAAELMPDAVASVPQDAAVEEILIQGMADCAFEENGVLHIVDYKTDRVHTAAELCDRYAPQLEIYAYALSRSLGLPIGSCLLYSFALDEVIPVPLK